jgi:hypothetical protein
MTIKAPFTDEQVKNLNEFQNSGIFHPFTCPRKHADEGDTNLVATKEGWFCPHPGCVYTQDWAHDFMAAKRESPDNFLHRFHDQHRKDAARVKVIGRRNKALRWAEPVVFAIMVVEGITFIMALLYYLGGDMLRALWCLGLAIYMGQAAMSVGASIARLRESMIRELDAIIARKEGRDERA